MSRVIFFILGVAVSLATGCVTENSSDPYGGEVVERSKEQPPAWTALDAGKLFESENLLKYVERQSQLTDLPFGIKRTQIDGLEASKLALRDRLSVQLQQVAATLNITANPHPELERYVFEATDELHRQHAKVADIYFEKFNSLEPIGPRGLTEYYQAQVLIHFPKDRMKDLLRDVATRLQKSQDLQLRSLGQAIIATSTTEITH